MTIADQTPWARLPVGLATVLQLRADRIQTGIITLIDAERGWTERRDNPKVRADLVQVTGLVVSRFIGLVGTTTAVFTPEQRARFREIGAGEAREGRGLEDLLAAYRIGTRVIYAEVADALAELDPSPAMQVALGEAVLALSDGLQAESAEGYAHEVSTHAGERERRLHRLVEALLAGDDDAVRLVAAQVGWPVPASVAAVLAPLEVMAGAQAAVGETGFVVERDGLVLAVLPSEGVARGVERLAKLVPDQSPGLRVGATVPRPDARRSLVTALLLPALEGQPRWAVDALPELLGRAAPEVTRTITERALGPLASLPPTPRARLSTTLAAWLRNWGQRSPIAVELGVHPQTVAYRVNQLRAVFGDDLDDPAWRLQAQLALLGLAQVDEPDD